MTTPFRPTLAEFRPDLAKEWHPILNGELTAEIATVGSTRRVWWLCSNGHSWQVALSVRVLRGNGCAYCAGKKAISGETDFVTLYPELAREWHPSLNLPLMPDVLRPNSNYDIWWVCKTNSVHVWKTGLKNRVANSSGCPFCLGRLVVSGVNDIGTLRPELIKEWNPKNSTKLDELALNSHARILWQCQVHYDHQWVAAVHLRSKGKGCPYCANVRVKIGFNDVATTHKHLIDEWHSDNEILPTEITYGSGKNIKWRCLAEGHEWSTQLSNRTGRGDGCPTCTTAHTSKAEQAFRLAFARVLDSINSDHLSKIMIPNLNKRIQVDIIGTFRGTPVVIEYDGYHHAKPNNLIRDRRNTKELIEIGYLVVRLREEKLPLVALSHPNLFQLNHLYSTKAIDIENTTSLVRDWLLDVKV